MKPTAGSTGPLVVDVCIVFAVLTFFVLVTRLFARIYVVKAFEPDDILITFACLLSWAFIVATILAVNHGLGSHIDTIPESEFPHYLQIVWLSSVFYNACLGFIKTSVLALYMRLGDANLRRRSLVVMVIVASSSTANVIACLFQCTPVRKAWDVTVTGGHCVDINAFYLANAALNIATDILTYVLPIDLVMHLQVPLKQKCGLGLMLGLGFFACLSSIIRITFIPRMLVSADATFAISPAMYWSVIETNIGILGASIPSFKSLFKRFLPRLVDEYSSKAKTTDRKYHSTKSETSRSSGFVELGEVKNRVEEVSLEDLVSHNRIDTNITGKNEGGYITSVNSSEERIVAPKGRIMAQTHITRHISGSADENF